MEDREIIALYYRRDESAILETKNKYRNYLRHIAENVLSSPEDAEECENDVYLSAWNQIPPDEPKSLKLYLAKIMRCRSVDRLRHEKAEKRSGNEKDLSLDELLEFMPERAEIDSGSRVEQEMEAAELGKAINAFLRTVSETDRLVFLRRYWFYDSLEETADRLGFTVSKVKTILFRLRGKLKIYLIGEGYYL